MKLISVMACVLMALHPGAQSDVAAPQLPKPGPCTVQLMGGTQFVPLELGFHRRDLPGSLEAQGLTVLNESLPFTRITDVMKGYTATTPDGPKIRAPIKYTKINQVVVLGLNIEDLRDGDPMAETKAAISDAVSAIRFGKGVPVLAGISLVYGYDDRGEVDAFNSLMYEYAQELRIPFALAPMLKTSWVEAEIVSALKNKKGAPTPPSALNLVVAQACARAIEPDKDQAQASSSSSSGSSESSSSVPK